MFFRAKKQGITVMPRRTIVLVAGAGLSLYAGQGWSELESMNDAELSEVDGAGLGVVLEAFKFSHGTDVPDANGGQARIFKIGGITSMDGRDVDITVNHLYISGNGSNYGRNLSPVISGA